MSPNSATGVGKSAAFRYLSVNGASGENRFKQPILEIVFCFTLERWVWFNRKAFVTQRLADPGMHEIGAGHQKSECHEYFGLLLA